MYNGNIYESVISVGLYEAKIIVNITNWYSGTK